MQSSSMMGEVVEPYAQALMSLAQSNNLVDAFGDNAAALLNVLKESADLRDFLANPLIDADKKKAVLGQVVGDQVHPFMRSFLMLLVDRRRIGYLEGICKQYQALLRELKQAVLAEVTSAVALNDGQLDAIRDKVKAITGAQQVDIETKTDADLIGGVIIKVGSQVIDASLRGQLRRIGLRLAA